MLQSDANMGSTLYLDSSSPDFLQTYPGVYTFITMGKSRENLCTDLRYKIWICKQLYDHHIFSKAAKKIPECLGAAFCYAFILT